MSDTSRAGLAVEESVCGIASMYLWNVNNPSFY